MREQFWLLPSGDASVALRATVFRPAGGIAERHPLVVINHGTSEANRMSVSMPVYYWLSRWFVDRGFAVVLPQRRGHGATGGTLVEAVGDCANPDHFRSGVIAAQDVGATVDFMMRQPFIDPARVRERTPYFPDRARMSREHYPKGDRGDARQREQGDVRERSYHHVSLTVSDAACG